MSSLFAGPYDAESESAESGGRKPSLFQQLKPLCIGLLRNASVTPLNAPVLTGLLKDVLNALKATDADITSSIVSYVFFPLSAILRHNEIRNFPNQVLEGIFRILAVLGGTWWWTSPLDLWDQLLILASGILVTIHADPGKWEDETKDAVVMMLIALLEPTPGAGSCSNQPPPVDTGERLTILINRAQTIKMVPILGSILNEVLVLCLAVDRTLQMHALTLTQIVVRHYIHEDMAPAVLPGVVSTSTRVALGTNQSRGWASAEPVAEGLSVLRVIIIKAMGNSVCLLHGAIVEPHSLDDLVALSHRQPEKQADSSSGPVPVPRTESWLRASASQVHIALNSLSPLLRHPSAVALRALLLLSNTLLREAHLTLTQSTSLLLSFLLSLASSEVAPEALAVLNSLLMEPAIASLREALLNIALLNINSLARAIRLQDDAKVEFLASQIEVIGRVTSGNSQVPNAFSRLLGPNGGIDKWGWKILNILELDQPPDVFVSDVHATVPQLLAGENVQFVQFPPLTFRNIRSYSGYSSLERMFRVLGQTAGDSALFTIEWFSQTAQGSTGVVRSTALWCTARLLEGHAGVLVNSEECKPLFTITKALEKLSRQVIRNIGETWDAPTETKTEASAGHSLGDDSQDDLPAIEFTTGLQKFQTRFDLLRIDTSAPKARRSAQAESVLQRSLSLQILTILSGTLGSTFTPLLLYSLYPILHSLVSVNGFLRISGMAALQHIANNIAYASVPNMLLANFDYALDAISQRLTRHRLDLDAAKVMASLVTLVGSDIVSRAEDIVEECFDRLDDYHGYKAVVEGLVEVLGRVLAVISLDQASCGLSRPVYRPRVDAQPLFESFTLWFDHWRENKEPKVDGAKESPPRTDWGDLRSKPLEEGIEQQGEEPNPSPTHELAKRILERSIPFLTHQSPLIRSRVLELMTSSVPVLSDKALLPSVHSAWPYVMNRLNDEDTFVVTAATGFIETLSRLAGDFMTLRIWEETWPRFKRILHELEVAEKESSLRRWTPNAGSRGTLSAYSNSHRLHRAILRTLTNAIRSTTVPHDADWEVAISCRRFLQESCHEDTQSDALQLYSALKERSEDLVWLVLSGTTSAISSEGVDTTDFLRKSWKIEKNVTRLFD